jgi:hypothetical protein
VTWAYPSVFVSTRAGARVGVLSTSPPGETTQGRIGAAGECTTDEIDAAVWSDRLTTQRADDHKGLTIQTYRITGCPQYETTTT